MVEPPHALEDGSRKCALEIVDRVGDVADVFERVVVRFSDRVVEELAEPERIIAHAVARKPVVAPDIHRAVHKPVAAADIHRAAHKPVAEVVRRVVDNFRMVAVVVDTVLRKAVHTPAHKLVDRIVRMAVHTAVAVEGRFVHKAVHMVAGIAARMAAVDNTPAVVHRLAAVDTHPVDDIVAQIAENAVDKLDLDNRLADVVHMLGMNLVVLVVRLVAIAVAGPTLVGSAHAAIDSH